jgi:hypothetical protein
MGLRVRAVTLSTSRSPMTLTINDVSFLRTPRKVLEAVVLWVAVFVPNAVLRRRARADKDERNEHVQSERANAPVNHEPVL